MSGKESKNGPRTIRKREKKNNKKHDGKIIRFDKEIQDLVMAYDNIDGASIEKFSDIPLSKRTLEGLKSANYYESTEIQKMCIGPLLLSQDVLGAAKTGSGKTLAFIIPVLECLFREKWTPTDGLAALIISPTRELAYQTYEVLCKVGAKHDFSAGLIIGGKDLKYETPRISRTNIIVCTPGRLLQHMDQTPYFACDTLKMLVLDEADRILDLGFASTMNAIIANLPPHRQTVLFSATQTKSVKDLARLSLKNPLYVSVHENDTVRTPVRLQQSYVVCDLHDKLDILFSFLRHHQKCKILVFLACCKQVKYVSTVFHMLRPGLPVLSLYGSLHQLKRMAVYDSFCAKQNCVLIATDIAARGLDFPAVNWVLQVDCPEDVTTYIHRAGRTARYEKDGESLLFLMPSEETSMVSQLTKHNIPINKIEVNMKKLGPTISKKLGSICASDVEIKEKAKRSFVGYMKSVLLMKDKSVFNVEKLDAKEFSRSLGLATCPRVRLIEKREKQRRVAAASSHLKGSGARSDTEAEQSDVKGSGARSHTEAEQFGVKGSGARSHTEAEQSGVKGSGTRSHTEAEQSGVKGSGARSHTEAEQSGVKGSGTQSTKGLSGAPATFDDDNGDSDEDGQLFTVKARRAVYEVEGKDDLIDLDSIGRGRRKKITKVALAKKMLKTNCIANKKITFDETGMPVDQEAEVTTSSDEGEGGIDIERAKRKMAAADKQDKLAERRRVLEKRKKEKEKRKKLAGTAPEDSDGGDSSRSATPDLSWLPDPDKIYGSRSPSVDPSNDDEESDGAVSKRRKVAPHESSSDESYDGELEDDEQMALALLGS